MRSRPRPSLRQRLRLRRQAETQEETSSELTDGELPSPRAALSPCCTPPTPKPITSEDEVIYEVEQTPDDLCTICITDPEACSLDPCAHRLCGSCPATIQKTMAGHTETGQLKCPMCRTVVKRLVPLEGIKLIELVPLQSPVSQWLNQRPDATDLPPGFSQTDIQYLGVLMLSRPRINEEPPLPFMTFDISNNPFA